VLAAALLGALALGVSWSLVGPFTFAWFSGVSWYIYVGVALAPILVWHSLYHTRGRPVAFWAERRSFLRLADHHRLHWRMALDPDLAWHARRGPSRKRAGPSDSAASVTFRSVTGYYRRFSLAEARGYPLAIGVGDETLSHDHGFPLRLVAPGKRGFEWVKWVEAIEVSESSKWWQPPLPLR
jgi:hypothetical protein